MIQSVNVPSFLAPFVVVVVVVVVASTLVSHRFSPGQYTTMNGSPTVTYPLNVGLTIQFHQDRPISQYISCWIALFVLEYNSSSLE